MNTKNIKVGFSVEGKNRKRRATYAIRALRKQMEKHLRTTDYVFDNSVNDFIWAKGKAESPNQIELTIVGDTKPRVFLADSKALKEYLEKGKEKKEAKKEEKKEAPKEKPKEEPKKEAKVESKDKQEKVEKKDLAPKKKVEKKK
jgi:ribosomal protein L31E